MKRVIYASTPDLTADRTKWMVRFLYLIVDDTTGVLSLLSQHVLFKSRQAAEEEAAQVWEDMPGENADLLPLAVLSRQIEER